jgi:hypothetical protein
MGGRFQPKLVAGARHANVVSVATTEQHAKDGSYLWHMRCDCGKNFMRPASKFKRVKTCGCGMKHNAGQFRLVDHTGIHIKDCEVLGPTTQRDSGGYVIWTIRCFLCGDTFTRPASAITRKSVSHYCSAWWAKYGPKRKHGRKPAPNSWSHVNLFYGHYRKSARERGIKFRLTKEEARTLFEGHCYYCGAVPKVTYKHPNLAGKYQKNGIDRVNSAEGYTNLNCVSCCSRCNWAKSNHSFDDFKEWVKRVYFHLGLHGIQQLHLVPTLTESVPSPLPLNGSSSMPVSMERRPLRAEDVF